MKRIAAIIVLAIAVFLPTLALAHFGMVIPDQPIMERPGKVNLEFRFWHPREGTGMDLARPARAGVMLGGKVTDLSAKLAPAKDKGRAIWRLQETIKKPGDYVFFMEPKPYWEPAEDCFIVHYTKAFVSALGAEEGWDSLVGLPMEIEPLTRPYGLDAGNSFTGRVLYQGKPLAGAEVEVEYYNQGKGHEPQTPSHVTQLVKTGPDGVFTWTMPWPGWWGFAALHTSETKMKKDGKDKDVELGGVIWVYVH